MKYIYFYIVFAFFSLQFSFSQISDLPYSISFEYSSDLGTTSASEALTKWTSVTDGTKINASDADGFCSSCIQWTINRKWLYS
jgi:hypothetical protein